jgi:hypothetical protein
LMNFNYEWSHPSSIKMLSPSYLKGLESTNIKAWVFHFLTL